jgi:hypothetical protein
MHLVGRQFVRQRQPSTEEHSMISIKLASIGLAAALTAILPAMPAQAAGVARTFLSAAGNDSNNCANVMTPCRHLAAAYAATAPNGEIYVLDPANYGSLTITGPVSIEGHGWASIAPASGGNAITINANSGDAINIIGVVLDGTALAGTNGIVFNSGGSLTVADSVVRNFNNNGSFTTGNGILMRPSSGTVSFVIKNAIVSNNGAVGVYYVPPSRSSATANVVIDHVVATNNIYGIAINTAVGGGGSTTVVMSNDVASNNDSYGIYIQNGSAALAVSIDNTSVSGNTEGIFASGTSNVLLGRSVITANGDAGIQNATNPNTFYSYQDNRINGNGTDIEGAMNSHALQ